MIVLRILTLSMLATLAYAQVAQVDMKRLSFSGCKNSCEAKRALAKLKPYKIATPLKNPLGSDVCLAQLGGKVVKIASKDYCEFSDKSAVELSGLHLESEKFLQP